MEVKPLKLAIIAIALCQFQTGVGKSKKPESFETVSVKKEIEPIYPGWAYQNGIGEGFARVAFYVDENGVASDFLVIEYASGSQFYQESGFPIHGRRLSKT